MNEELFRVEDIKQIHQSGVDRIRHQCGHELSSHTFANLYLWQQHMGLRLHLEEDFFAVKCEMRGKHTWFFPCGNENALYEFVKEGMQQEDFSFCFLRECDVQWLEKRFPDQWEFCREEESDEYICDISEYLSLKGSKFADIRRKLRHLERTCAVEAKKISPETIQDAKAVVSGWEGGAHHTGMDELTDEGVAEEALAHREALEIEGIVLYLDGIPSAVFAGFPVNEDMLDVLIGKCVPDSPRGTVYYALRCYLDLCGKGYTYCNHEEDLGIAGIRQVKTSLCPIRKNEIWKAVLK